MDNIKVCLCGGTGDCKCPPIKVEQVNHPLHYGGVNNPYEAIDTDSDEVVKINLDNIEYSDDVKNKIREEFDHILIKPHRY